MNKYLRTYKGSKKLLVWITLFTIAQGLAIIYQAIYLSKGITSLFHGTAWSAVLPSFFTFLFYFFLRQFFQWSNQRISYRFAEQTATELQTKLVQKLFRIGPHGIAQHGSGTVITLCLEGIENVKKFLKLFFPRFISVLIIPVMILVVTYSYDTQSGIVLTITMPIMILFVILLGLAAQKKINDQMATFRLLSRHFVDSLRGIVTLKYLGKSKEHAQSIETVSEKYRIATNRTLIIAFLSSFCLNFFSSLSIAVLAVFLGVRLIDGQAAFEVALTILILAPDYFQPVRDFGNDFHATMDGKKAAEQIHDILEQRELPRICEKIGIDRWNDRSTLALKRICKESPNESRQLLKDISLDITGYKKIGIIGTSGAGKSTLIDLLSGFSAPTAGEIQINGVTVPHLGFVDWQDQIAYIPQHPYIFSGTVKQNITWYTPDATEEQVEEAVELTGLSALIKNLPHGLEERIGAGGRTLSGGEEQRIALARTILQDRPIMLFDEPTAHLDIETEHEIKEMMLPLMEEKLVFFATHRLHWMREMDLILVIEKGRLRETITPENLFCQKDTYNRLIRGVGRNEATI